MAYTPSEFAQKIRKKYPDAYEDIDDNELTRRFIAKYPVYKDDVSFEPEKPQAIPKAPPPYRGGYTASIEAKPAPRVQPSLRAPRAGEITEPITPEQETELSRRREVRYLQEEAPPSARFEQRAGSFISGTPPAIVSRIALGKKYGELTGFQPEAQQAFPYSKMAGELSSFAALGPPARAAVGAGKAGLTLAQTAARQAAAGGLQFGAFGAAEETARQRELDEELSAPRIASHALTQGLTGAGFAASHVIPPFTAGRLPPWMADSLGQALTSRLIGAAAGGGVAGISAAAQGADPLTTAANVGAFFLLGLYENRSFQPQFKAAARNSVVEPAVRTMEASGIPRPVAQQQALTALDDMLLETNRSYNAIYRHPKFKDFYNAAVEEIQKAKPGIPLQNAQREALDRINLSIAGRDISIEELNALKFEYRKPEIATKQAETPALKTPEAAKVTPGLQEAKPSMPEQAAIQPRAITEPEVPPTTKSVDIGSKLVETTPAAPAPKTPDAEFIGFDRSDPDNPFAMFNITKPGHYRIGSTVSANTLEKEGLEVPEIPVEPKAPAIPENPIISKETFQKSVQEKFRLPEEQAKTVSEITDARARAWAKATGKSPEDWYKTRVGAIERGGEPSPQALEQGAGEKTDTPAFKQWFGKSKVVDAEGKPLVVYHGTTEDFTEFKKSPGVRMGILGSTKEVSSPAFFFTENKAVADFFGKNRADYKFDRPWLGKTMEVFLKLENPIDLTKKNDSTINKLKNIGVDLYKKYGHKSNDYKNNDFAANLDASAINFWEILDDAENVGKLKVAGYDGAILIEGGKGFVDPDKRKNMGRSYAVFSPTQIKSTQNIGTFDPNNPNILFQGPRGSVEFVDDGKAIIRAFEQADVSTVIHELGHIMRRDLEGQDLAVIEQWAGVQEGNWTREAEEKFARGFEAYLHEGKAPTSELEAIFAKIKAWLAEVYKSIKELKVELNDDVRSVFDKLLGKEPPKPPKEPPAPPGGLAPEPGKPSEPKIVNQTFKTKKFNLTDQQSMALELELERLGMGKRRVRSDAELIDAAQELGMDPAKLLKETPSGRLTDAEIKALSDLINNNMRFYVELQKEIQANPAKAEALQDKADLVWDQMIAAMKKQVRAGIEVGRGLRAFRLLAKNSMEPHIWFRQAQKVLGQRQFTPEMAQAIMDLIAKADQQGLANFISMLREPAWSEKAITAWKAGLLTAPTTHIANISGNLGMASLSNFTDVVATPVDVLASIFTGKRTTTFSLGMAHAQAKGLVKGLGEAKKIMKGELYDVNLGGQYGLPRRVPFKNKILQAYTDAIFNALRAEDAVFKQAALGKAFQKQAEITVMNEKLKGQAKIDRMRELLLEPTNEMVANAINAAEYDTFNDKNALADFIASGKKALLKPGKEGKVPLPLQALHMGAEVTLPFTRTPANIASRILDYSPGGFIKALVRQIDPQTRGQQALVEDLSRGITGTGVILAGAALAAAGLMTGNAPEKDKERDQFYAEGKIPHAIYLNGRWFGLNRISPVGNLLALGATFAETAEEKTGSDLAVASAFGAIKQIKEQSFLMGVQRLETATTYPSSAEKFINNTVASLVPTIIARLARTIDPTIKAPDNLVETIAARLPFFSGMAPVRRDVFGEPATAGGGRLNLFDPFASKPSTQDPVLKEARRIGVGIGIPDEKVVGVKMTNREFSIYQKMQGRLLKRTLTAYMDQSGDATDQEKAEAFEDIIRDVRKEANQTFFPALMIRRYNLSPDTGPDAVVHFLREMGKNNALKRASQNTQEKWLKKQLKQ